MKKTRMTGGTSLSIASFDQGEVHVLYRLARDDRDFTGEHNEMIVYTERMVSEKLDAALEKAKRFGKTKV